jgi:hypothetical protein
MMIRRSSCIFPRFSPAEARGTMTNWRRVLCRLLALLALVSVGGCAASGPEPTLEAAYSAVGAQVK